MPSSLSECQVERLTHLEELVRKLDETLHLHVYGSTWCTRCALAQQQIIDAHEHKLPPTPIQFPRRGA